MTKAKSNKMLIRLLSLVSRSGQGGISFEIKSRNIVLKLPNGVQNVPTSTFSAALSRGLVSKNSGRIVVTRSGVSSLKRHLCDHDPYAGQHRILQSNTLKIQGQIQQVTVNLAESPLSRLYARKQKNGSRFLTRAQYEAGGRLRRDFEKAQMQPSITARWQESSSTGSTARTAGGSGDMSEFAMDARSRVERAFSAIGPELSGVTLDICCYLKGFETVERERSWPGRSAKLMLKAALAGLSRHYSNAAPDVQAKGQSNITQWGTGDYRPNITRDRVQ